MGEQNQRQHPRIRTDIPAVVEIAGRTVEGIVENLGKGGAFFATESLEEAIEAGGAVRLRYRDPETDADRVRAGSVLRIERYFHEGGLYRALAIRFEDA
ncbi:MAG: PilZ domain-containing protein [Planctomycetota bacterium]